MRSSRQIYNQLKASAQRRGIPFSLTLSELNEITIPITCPILGIPIRFNRKQQDDSISFDRIDSSRGYEIDNIQIISWRANRAKNNLTQEELNKFFK
jgi:hypothetical protein